MVCGSPAISHPRSFTRKGTPRNGPSGSGPAASARAASKRSWITALMVGSRRRMRSMASSTSSTGDAAPDRTSAASSVASGSGCGHRRAPVDSGRLDDEDGALGVMGAAARHAAEQEAPSALHSTVADDEQIGVDALAQRQQRIGGITGESVGRRLGSGFGGECRPPPRARAGSTVRSPHPTRSRRRPCRAPRARGSAGRPWRRADERRVSAANAGGV